MKSEPNKDAFMIKYTVSDLTVIWKPLTWWEIVTCVLKNLEYYQYRKMINTKLTYLDPGGWVEINKYLRLK